MSAEEKLKLIQLLCSSGVTYFKCHEFELRIDSQKAKESPHIDSKPLTMNHQQAVVTPAAQYNAEDTEKLLKLIDTLKLKDEDLANHIFPDGAL